MSLPNRGVTPGLPTNGGSFRASERTAPDLTLTGPAPISERIKAAEGQAAKAAQKVAEAEAALRKAERSPFGRKRGIGTAITMLSTAYRDLGEHQRHLTALRRDLAKQEQRDSSR